MILKNYFKNIDIFFIFVYYNYSLKGGIQMKSNYKKILLMFLLIFLITFSRVYALDLFLSQSSNDTPTSSQEDALVDIDENVETKNEQDASEISDEEIITYGNSDSKEDLTYELTSARDSSSPTITTAVTHDDTLSISDIINIILISVCVVLIFLGIAILIRCK